MDDNFTSFSLDTNNSVVYSSSSENLMADPQNMAGSLINGRLSYSSYFLPYGTVSLQFPYHQQVKNQPLSYNPVCSFPMGNHLLHADFCGIQTWQSQNEEKKNDRAIMMRKVAKYKRKRASSILEQARSVAFRSMEDKVQKNVSENRIPDTVYSLDGKCLRKLLTKKLKPSDVGHLGRIVLPKKEAEENLPTLFNKKGIEVVLKDVCTDRQWSIKYKYWYNNRSRMYILENTGDFVMHYELQIGDYLTLYGDDYCKNLYVLPKKEQASKVAEPLSSKEVEIQENSNICNPYSHQVKYEEKELSFAMLIDELYQKEQESGNNNPLCSNIEGPSTTRLPHNNNTSQDLSRKNTISEGLDNLDDFFEGLDKSQFGCNFLLDEKFVDA